MTTNTLLVLVPRVHFENETAHVVSNTTFRIKGMFFISRAAAGFLFQSREGFTLKYSTLSCNGNGKRVKKTNK